MPRNNESVSESGKGSDQETEFLEETLTAVTIVVILVTLTLLFMIGGIMLSRRNRRKNRMIRQEVTKNGLGKDMQSLKKALSISEDSSSWSSNWYKRRSSEVELLVAIREIIPKEKRKKVPRSEAEYYRKLLQEHKQKKKVTSSILHNIEDWRTKKQKAAAPSIPRRSSVNTVASATAAEETIDLGQIRKQKSSQDKDKE